VTRISASGLLRERRDRRIARRDAARICGRAAWRTCRRKSCRSKSTCTRPAPPNAAPPAQPNPASVNLYDNIERLTLVIDQILPLHGRKVPLAELQKWIGNASQPNPPQHSKRSAIFFFGRTPDHRGDRGAIHVGLRARRT
jgi:hypothetical protein